MAAWLITIYFGISRDNYRIMYEGIGKSDKKKKKKKNRNRKRNRTAEEETKTPKIMATHPHHTVPRTSEVIPGAKVSIILKADQPTGREVQGTVRDVLTRGDHHRGIKVRLTDGRIGRVQRMSSENPDSSKPSPGVPASAGSEQLPDGVMGSVGGSTRRRGQQPRYRDVRLDEPLEAPAEQVDLAAYIVPSKRKGKGKKGQKADQPVDATVGNDDSVGNNSSAASKPAPTTATCPVCNAFEGDEAAVAHHVAGHFE